MGSQVDLDMLSMDEDLLMEMQFVAAMVGLSPNEMLANAVEMSLDQRAELPEFKAGLERYIAGQATIIDRLGKRVQIGARRRMRRETQARRARKR